MKTEVFEFLNTNSNKIVYGVLGAFGRYGGQDLLLTETGDVLCFSRKEYAEKYIQERLVQNEVRV